MTRQRRTRESVSLQSCLPARLRDRIALLYGCERVPADNCLPPAALANDTILASRVLSSHRRQRQGSVRAMRLGGIAEGAKGGEVPRMGCRFGTFSL